MALSMAAYSENAVYRSVCNRLAILLKPNEILMNSEYKKRKNVPPAV
jgi:hypothetical protein